MKSEIKQRIDQLNNGEIPNGYKETECGVFPVEWETKRLGELLDFKNGVNADKEKYNSGTKMISVNDILTDRPIVYASIQGHVDIDEDALKEYGVTYGDVLFQRSSETFEDSGKANVYLDPDRAATYSGFVIRGKKKAEYEPYYLNEALRIRQVRKQIIRHAAGSQHINVGQDSLASVTIPFASSQEQLRIAEILMKWDEAIELQELLIERRKTLCARYIELLLTPKAEWIRTALGKVIEEISITTTENNQHEVVSSTKKGLFAQKEYFDKQIASENNVGYKVLRKGNIVLSPQNLWLGNINYNDVFEIGIVSPSYKIFEVKEDFDELFVASLMKTPRMLHQYILASEQGASVVRRNLNMELFYDIPLFMPSLQEQRRISEIIRQITDLLKLENDKLDSMERQRKSLQQYLLNGIVRVKYE